MAGELDENQWGAIFDIAHAAADLAPAGRRRFIESATNVAAIRQRALELADEFARSSPFLALDIGSQIGKFTITGRLGRGGMGQVYAADDRELQRTVALKVLHADLDGIADSAKLLREARTASALNHPNIITIHEVLKEGPDLAIVMEFVPGDSLRTWTETPRLLRETLPVMAQIASAIEAAHAAGIVHRDIKPENVIVRPDGRIKVLDFGLARTVDRKGAFKAADPEAFTGTLRYLAPEQWDGAAPQAASDIFSLGVMFYEIASGKHPFEGDPRTGQCPAPPSARRTGVPPALDELILGMLAQAPVERPPAAEVVTILTALTNDSKHSPATPALKTQRGIVKILTLLGLCVAGAVIWQWQEWDFPARFRIADDFLLLPLANELGYYHSPSFAPDGGQIVFSWNGRNQDNFDLYIVRVGSQATRRLTTSDAVDYSPAWSPDGKTIAFCRGEPSGSAAIWTMPAAGGRETRIADLRWRIDHASRHLSWSADSQRIAFPDGSAGTNGLRELELATGKVRQITFPAGPQLDVQPAYSPDGRFLAFVRDHGGGVNRLYILPLDKGAAAPYSLDWEGLESTNIGRPVWTPDSRWLLVVANSGGTNARLFVGPARWNAKPHLLASLSNNIYDAAISPTGRLAAVYQHYDSDIYKLDLARLRQGGTAVPQPVANSTRLEQNPKVSPDGRTLAYESNRSGFMEVWTIGVDGSNARALTGMRHAVTGSPSWSRDGRRIAFDSRAGGSPRLYVMGAADGEPLAVTKEADDAVVPSWSAGDGFLYFASDRGQNWEIWRMPAGGGVAQQITRNGGFAAVASPDGATLYYTVDRARVTELRSLNLAAGNEKMIARDVLRRNYAATGQGVYYVSGQTVGPRDLKFADRAGHISQVFRFERSPSEGLDVSPDGETLYFGQMKQDGTELMLVEHFWRDATK